MGENVVELGRRVKVHYIGTLDDGTEFDNTIRQGTPLEYIVGSRQVLAGFDRAVSEMEVGKTRTIHIPASEAYGAYDESLIEAVPVSVMPHTDQLPIGEYIAISTSAGDIRVKVMRIEKDMVYLDHNHELAGEDLNFSIELVSVYGEYESSIERELHPAGCACGCDQVKKALS